MILTKSVSEERRVKEGWKKEEKEVLEVLEIGGQL